MDTSELVPFIDDFLKIYPKRPVRDNVGGMGLNHCFGLYSVLRSLRPSLVVESGVWKGQSTWIIEQAVPEASIVCIDPQPDRREYTSSSARYETSDFSGIDWSSYDTEDSFCFFDDHQNAYARLVDMRWWGFRRAIMEDNFPVGQGDCYSIRHVMSGVGHPRIQMSPDYQPKGRGRLVRRVEETILRRFYWRQQMIREPNQVDKAGLLLNLSYQFEIPALVLNATNNWGGVWGGDYSETVPPVFSSQEQSELLSDVVNKLEDPDREMKYCYMMYLELTGN